MNFEIGYNMMELNGENIKIIFDDIYFEVEYLIFVVLCYVFGVNLLL